MHKSYSKLVLPAGADVRSLAGKFFKLSYRTVRLLLFLLEYDGGADMAGSYAVRT